MNNEMRIKPGYGYYDTTYFPIGGSFHRSPTEGLRVIVTRKFKMYEGVNTEGRTTDGRTVAFRLDHADQEEIIFVK